MKKMLKGIFLGLVAQFIFALGLVFIKQASFTESQNLLKSSLVLMFAGLISVLIVAYLFWSKPENFSVLNTNNTLYLVVGALFLFIIGDYLYIRGMSESNATAVALTAIAFPLFALLIEYAELKFFGKTIPSLKMQHIIGFFSLVAGYTLISME